MEKDKLKISLLEKIIACEDAATLKRVEKILLQVSEPGGDYFHNPQTELSRGLNISPELEEELKRRYEDHLQKKGKYYSWKEIRQDLKDSYGI